MASPRAPSAAAAWVRALASLKAGQDAGTMPALLEVLAARHGDRPALLGQNEALSYAGLARRINQVARWALARPLPRGTVVCLLMPNRPDYAAIWLGLARAGCATALINTNLAGDALLHSIAAAGSRHVLVAASLLPVLDAVADRLPAGTQVWCTDAGDFAVPEDGSPLPPAECPWPLPTERALLIYTSGTTGLPKAANVTHARVMEWSSWFAGMMDAHPEDRLYDCLPMYHSVGGVVAIGSMLFAGGSVLIRERFSASRFWDDVAEGCTVVQYIGELCRYLLAAPPHPRERTHRLRLACGNGLAGDVWLRLQQRFAIPAVLEFYAATEGGVSLYNVEGKPGAIGRVPPMFAHRFGVLLVRCDPAGTPLRDLTGLCIPCGVDEPGEALGRIGPGRGFDGYTDPAASGRKLLQDVMAPGDRWFRTGDLMRRDAAGFYYFLDRLGDTFRWKGENVSTTEVATALRACSGVTEAAVFGVAVPGHEGRAGMAALTTAAGFDLAEFHAAAAAALPAYAVPVFVRLCGALAMTGTFKLAKGALVEEGFAVADGSVWVRDREAGRYIQADAAVLGELAAGTRRL